MTIIKNLRGLRDTPVKSLDLAIVGAITDSWTPVNAATRQQSEVAIKTAIILLDSFCDLYGCSLSLENFPDSTFGRYFNLFARVLKGESLIDINYNHKRNLFNSIKQTLIVICESKGTAVPSWLSDIELNNIKILDLDESKYNDISLYHWACWPVVSSKGKYRYLNLSPLVESHGSEFAVQYYSRWKGFYAKQKAAVIKIPKTIANYLVENNTLWHADTFNDPIAVSQFFNELLKDVFLKANKKGHDLDSTIRFWNALASNVNEVFIESRIWAEPFGRGITKVPQLKIKGTKTHISKNSKGVEVHQKLITEVPLQVTDEQAIELLFSDIEKDIDIVRRWANSQASDLRKRQKRRIFLSRSGTPIKGISFTTRSMEDHGHENICATFEENGFIAYKTTLPGRNVLLNFPRKKMAHLLGLPCGYTLFPFMALLVIDNPKITPSFLSEFDLYNKNGRLSGFVKTDFGYQLTGYKDRRKTNKSEQKIFLSPRSASIVRQVVEITSPLRNYLKSQGDDKWRKLFLTCGIGFSYPIAGNVSAWKAGGASFDTSIDYFKEVEKQFSSIIDLREEELKTFLRRISLSSIRASTGVLVYLKTQSVHKMAEALGHNKYSGAILKHYLPESILAFFQTRWIRIFQRAFVCEAMKGSSFLIEAANFRTMKELHDFLSSHAIKDIPEHLNNPEIINIKEQENSFHDQVLISIDTGILSALLSLNRAVESSKSPAKVSGLARYWSDMSALVEQEIENGTDPLLKRHLLVAKSKLNPHKMERIIYEFTIRA